MLNRPHQLSLFFLLLSCIISITLSSNILVVLYPWPSRLGVITELAATIANNSDHSISILTSIDFIPAIQKRFSKYSHISPSSIHFITYNSFSAESHAIKVMSKPPIEVIPVLVDVSFQLANMVLLNETIMNELRSFTFDILIGDFIDATRVALAAILGIQRVDVDTGAAGASAAAAAYNLRIKTSYVPAYGSELPMGPYSIMQKAKNFITDFAVSTAGRVLIDKSFNYLVANTSYASYHEACKRGVLLSIVSCDWAFQPTRLTAPFEKFVGPFLPHAADPLDAELASSLATAKHIIVVSPGSTMFFTHKCSAAIMHALVAMQSTLIDEGEIRIVWKLADKHREEIQAALGLTLTISALETHHGFIFLPWIPQNDVLADPSTRMFIFHCGMQGMNEAVYHGVKTLCLPIATDQIDNAHNVRNREIGDFIPEAVWKKGGVKLFEETLSRVYLSDTYTRNARAMSARLRSHPRTPLQLAHEWVEYAINIAAVKNMKNVALPEQVSTLSVVDAASFLKPAEMHMSWMDLHSLDLLSASPLLFLYPLIRRIIVLIHPLTKAILEKFTALFVSNHLYNAV